MNYGYIRVSTDKQTTENQRFEIEKYCALQPIKINEWIEETISATKRLDERKFGALLQKMEKGDQLIVTELSRLGRNLMQIMSILHGCMEKDIKVYTIKERYELGKNISSKVLAFAFGLSAEIERNLISQRTKEALARKKAEGVILGRPKGRKSDCLKLTGKENEIRALLNKRISYSAIARILVVHRLTVSTFVKNNNLHSLEGTINIE
jgi:DNA invertase Pin-like site-specific DNA recombinase